MLFVFRNYCQKQPYLGPMHNTSIDGVLVICLIRYLVYIIICIYYIYILSYYYITISCMSCIYNYCL